MNNAIWWTGAIEKFFLISGIVLWLLLIGAIIAFIYVDHKHIYNSFIVTVRIFKQSKSKFKPITFIKWWWHNWIDGPYIYVKLKKGGTVYWPGEEPEGYDPNMPYGYKDGVETETKIKE